jgi:hypothetical protein
MIASATAATASASDRGDTLSKKLGPLRLRDILNNCQDLNGRLVHLVIEPNEGGAPGAELQRVEVPHLTRHRFRTT